MGYSVLIIDDHELFSTALMMALREQGCDAHQVVASAGIDAILNQARQRRPGLVVLDLHLGRDVQQRPMHGVELVQPLRTQGWTVLVVSGGRADVGVAAAVAAGAVGSVPKSSSFEALLRTVLTASAGAPVMTERERQSWLVRHRGYRAQEKALGQRLGRLSAREREVLALLVQGNRAAGIAERFVVSMTTVRTQIRSILTKLEVNSQLEAVALARRQAPR